MSSVSSNTDNNKAKLFQERREKLAKWKQKKAQQDEQKKKELTNTENSHNKLTESHDELKDAQRRKLGGHSEESQGSKAVKRRKKHKNKTSNKLSFAESDEETVIQPPKLFNPKEVQLPGEIPSNDAEGGDPLEQYMNSLSNGAQPAPVGGGNLVDEEGSDFVSSERENPSDQDGSSDENEAGLRFARITKMKLKKQVKEIHYAKEELEPFRKDFYVQQRQPTMTDNELYELRLNLGNIKVRGTGCPVPITRWSQLGLTTDVINLIVNDLKYEYPTPIQAQAIPAIMCGRDVIGISKTGSGKTISYLLPLIRQIKAQRPLSKDETGPLGLVLAPTRELALQIHEEVEKFTSTDQWINSVCCTGGSELKKQIKNLKKGVEIVVATPGRFIDLLTLNSGHLVSTRRTTFVVMDEADRLFDLGFEPQITQIMKTIRPDKQCVLFSATFPNKLRNFALRVLQAPLSITINSKNLVNENITQKFYVADSDEEKFNKLLQVLEHHEQQIEEKLNEESHDYDGNDEKTIIFVSSQQICDLIHIKLENEGYTIYSIHAGKPYQDRVANLEQFRATRNSILLCTEVLSRGLNVPEVSLVIIYSAVKCFAQYVHTTGRTARGTHTGVAMMFLLPDELAGAYILFKSIRDNELIAHDPKQIEMLKSMSQNFEQGMKSGKFKVSQGFGGKGLDNLESKRKEKHLEEKRNYEDETSQNKYQETEVKEPSPAQVQIPKLKYNVLQQNNPNGTVTFAAEVNVNDLPQLVRWEATKNTTFMFIKNETGCSITNKGKYYPEGKEPQSDKDEPKLFLLIESDNEKDIKLCIDLLEQKVKEGIRKAGIQSIKNTKY